MPAGRHDYTSGGSPQAASTGQPSRPTNASRVPSMNAMTDLARAISAAPTSTVPASLFGLAFGGCRFWTYDNELAALNDALRLSQGMSLKNALADLPFGGGKAVILKPAGWNADTDRSALFAAFGRAVQSLGGAYITAEDV